jgi:hypothetical protein
MNNLGDIAVRIRRGQGVKGTEGSRRLKGVYSVSKHVVKPKFPQKNNKETLTIVGASVFSPNFSYVES